MSIIDITKDLNPHKNIIYNNSNLTNKIIIDRDEVFNKPILLKEPKKDKYGKWKSASTPIAQIITIDTEYQDIGNFLATQAKYNDNNDKYDNKYISRNNCINFCNEVEQNYLYNYGIDIHKFIRNPHNYREELSNIPENYLEDDYYTLQAPELISIQIKNSLELEEKGKIYLSNCANQFREAYISDNPHLEHKFKDYKYPVLINDRSVIEQFMQHQNYDYKIEIVCSEDYYDEILPVFTINIVMFFGIVDIPFIFPARYYEAIDYYIKKGIINHDKRFKSGFFNSETKKHELVKPHWITEINGYRYKVRLNFIDACAMQGVIGLKQFYKNNNIDIVDKGLLDNYKPKMFEALLEEPEHYHNYALGDIRIYEPILNFNNSIYEMSKKIGIEKDRIKEISFTLGSTVNNQILNKEHQLFHANTRDEKEQFIEQNCRSASSKYLGMYNYFNDDLKKNFDTTNSFYIRMLLAKLYGGRCNSTNPLLCELYNKDKNKQNFIFDIDKKGAYTTTMSTMYKYYGETVSYVYRKGEYFSLREYYNIFKKEFGKDNYYIIVSGKLQYKQDLIPSCINSDKSNKREITIDEQGNTEVVVKFNPDNSKTIILNKEIINGVITSATLDVIFNGFHPLQKDDFLDNLKVHSMLINPLSMEVKTIEELKEKVDEHNKGKKNHSVKLHREYLDTERGNKCHYYYKKEIGEFFIDDIRSLRNYFKHENLPDSSSKEEAYKTVGNTSYGTSVSDQFPNSNMIFGNNITANVRCNMWLMEKALNIVQSITDGGIFDFFNVKHRVYDYLDSRLFVDSYQYTKRELSDKKKWYNRSLNYREAVHNKKLNTWFFDGKIYDEKPVINNEAYYNEDTKTWFISGIEYDETTIKKIISKLCVEHVRKCFPKVKLVNDEYRCFKEDETGKILRDENDNPIYTIQHGMFDIEVKNIVNKVYFSGMSNYMLYNNKGELCIKTRSYETKKDENGFLRKEHTTILKSENEEYLFKLCELTHQKTAITEKFYNLRELDVENVPLLDPVLIPTILKTKDYRKKYNSTYKYNSQIRPGCTVYKLVQKFYFEISQFHFSYVEQYIALEKLNAKLKREYGIDIAIFFINKNTTVNYKKMITTINDLINNGVVDFLKGIDKIVGLDPHNHINRKVPDEIKKYVNRTEHSRLYLRLLNVGAVQFNKEKGKVKENITDYNELDFDDKHKKSHSSEFENEDEFWK